jgi:hypothetical protein
MNYIRSLYHRAAGLLLSLSDLDNLHRKVPILSPPLALTMRLSPERERERGTERDLLSLEILPLNSNIVRQYAGVH